MGSEGCATETPSRSLPTAPPCHSPSHLQSDRKALLGLGKAAEVGGGLRKVAVSSCNRLQQRNDLHQRDGVPPCQPAPAAEPLRFLLLCLGFPAATAKHAPAAAACALGIPHVLQAGRGKSTLSELDARKAQARPPVVTSSAGRGMRRHTITRSHKLGQCSSTNAIRPAHHAA